MMPNLLGDFTPGISLISMSKAVLKEHYIPSSYE